MLNANRFALSIRHVLLSIFSICFLFYVVWPTLQHSTLLPQILGFNTKQDLSSNSVMIIHSKAPPFQIRINSERTLARYLRHRGEGATRDVLVVVFEETSRDEPLLLTLDADEHTLRFHSVASTHSSAAQQIWIAPNENSVIRVGDLSDGASYAPFDLTSDGRLTFNG